ncbi:MAG: hypothetical protein ACR2RB_21935 [Gammaproteobacteria bacterium]
MQRKVDTEVTMLKPDELANEPDPAVWREETSHQPDLIDLWLIFASRRKVFFAVAAAVLALVGAFVLTLDPVYESRAVVQIGKVGAQPVEPVDTVLSRLTAIHIPPSRAQRGYPFIEKVEKDEELESDLIVIKARGRAPDEARDHLEQVLRAFVAEHQQQFSEDLQLKHSRVQELEGAIGDHRSQAQSLSAVVAATLASDPSQAALAEIEKASLLARIDKLEKDKKDLESTLSGLYTRPTRVILEADLPKESTQPGYALLGVIGVLAALVAGIIAAYLVQFVANLRQGIRERTTN